LWRGSVFCCTPLYLYFFLPDGGQYVWPQHVVENKNCMYIIRVLFMWTELSIVVSVELFNPTYAPSWRTIFLSAVRNGFFTIWVFSDNVPYKDTFFSIRIRRTH
jgi:hypothetical protein